MVMLVHNVRSDNLKKDELIDFDPSKYFQECWHVLVFFVQC